MATENQLMHTPIRLFCDRSRPIGLKRSRNSVIVACDHKNTILTTGLFLAPQTLRGHKGVFYFFTSGVNPIAEKNTASDGVFVITSDASMFKWMNSAAESSIVFSSSTALVEYLTASGSDEAVFSFVGEKADTKHLFALHGTESVFAFDADAASTDISKFANSDRAICVIGAAYAEKIVYANSDGDFALTGMADMTIVGYEEFAPSDSDGFIDANGEEFITIRSDDNGA